jgi:hypothetical protein
MQVYIFHGGIVAGGGESKKPTVVFLARFFLAGRDGRIWLRGKGLQREKSQKTGKTQKKVQNSFGGRAVFLQNGPVFRAKTGPCQSGELQAAAVVWVREAGPQPSVRAKMTFGLPAPFRLMPFRNG